MQSDIGQRRQRNCSRPPLGDELPSDALTAKRHTVGVALKDRSLSLPNGRTGDEAFLVDATTATSLRVPGIEGIACWVGSPGRKLTAQYR